MAYKELIIAVAILLVIILIPTVYLPLTTQSLSDEEVQTIATNFVETNTPNTMVVETTITERSDDVWKITVTYKQGEGANCKIGKCYWEGPASQFCRSESNQTLRPC